MQNDELLARHYQVSNSMTGSIPYIYIYRCIYICIYICMYIYICIYVYVCIMYVCIYIYVYMYICMYKMPEERLLETRKFYFYPIKGTLLHFPPLSAPAENERGPSHWLPWVTRELLTRHYLRWAPAASLPFRGSIAKTVHLATYTLYMYMVDSPKVGQLLILSQFLGKMKNVARS